MKTEELAADVLRILAQRGMTLATAESCTGGLVGKLLTDIPGSSAVYMGGVISYTNGVKKSIAFEKRNRIPFYNFEICRFDSSILYIRAENVG